MPKKIGRLVCNVRVEHKTKGQIQFVPNPGERPMLIFQSAPPIEHDEQTPLIPRLDSEPEPDPREVDPYKVADRVYQIMLSETRARQLRGG